MNIEKIAETSTRELLYFLKSAKKCTRQQLATLLQCSVRQLTDYMLPPSSKAHRDMPNMLRSRLEHFCKKEIEKEAMIASGTWVKRDELGAAFVGPLSGARYPHFYLKHAQEMEDIDDETAFKISDIKLIDGKMYRYYTFDAHCSDLSELGGGAKKIEEVFSIDPDVFKGWISIIRLESREQIDGFIEARQLLQGVIKYDDDGSKVIYTPDGLFMATLHDPEESPAFNGLIVLKARYPKMNKVFGHVMDEFETIVINQDGSVIEDGYEHLMALAGHPDYSGD